MGLDNYEVGEELLRRGPSTFYRARNAILGNEVILRRLELDPLRADDARETFFREQRLSAKLSHPRIQRPIDVFSADGSLYSVHDLLMLRSALEMTEQSGPFAVADAARIGAQVADALAHMHARGHVHGKISPVTVLVDERGEGMVINLVKAADLAAGMWPLRPAVLGLSPFSAPEEFRGERPTPSSDLYGLAATVFYWLTLRWPRGGADHEAALANASAGAPLLELAALRPDAPPVLVERLGRALEADPSRRHGSAASLGSILVETHQRLAAEIPSGFATGNLLAPTGTSLRVELLGRHGAGAFGVVLRARTARDGLQVAVKALKPEHRDNHEAYERFLREARALQQIDHPNVVRVLGVGEVQGTPYAVMEFVPGPDLATLLLREGALSPARVERVGRGLARGLEAIHEEGIIHRDLKPHNVLLASEDRPVIADFGVARSSKVTRMTMTGNLVGTPSYMAPEQFDERPPTPAADMYALGTILYELLTGRVPFIGGDTVTTIRAIREKQPAALDAEVPRHLSDLIFRLLDKDPENRPTARELWAEAPAERS